METEDIVVYYAHLFAYLTRGVSTIMSGTVLSPSTVNCTIKKKVWLIVGSKTLTGSPNGIRDRPFFVILSDRLDEAFLIQTKERWLCL